MKTALPWIGALAGVITVALGLGLGVVDAGTLILALILASIVSFLAFRVATESDRSWLPKLIIAGYAVKILGSLLRYYVLVESYSGVGDAIAYYNRGLAYADDFRSFRIPDIRVGGAGTTFLSKATALLFAPYKPTLVGGFFLFATLAFIGQVLFYLAFRRVMPDHRHQPYALAVVFLPSLIFWPSSIGKDSMIVMFLGVVAWGTAHLLGRYRIRWLVAVAIGLLGAGAIRPHVAALFGAAIAAAVLLGKSPMVKAARTRRLVLMVAAGFGVVLLFTFASESFGVDLSGDDLDPFLAELQRTTQAGGSAVDGQAVSSLRDIPQAVLRTLYRPLLNEVVNMQTRLAAIEGTVLLIVTIFRVPAMLRDVRRWRRYPFLVFSFVAVSGFVIGFSAVFNLGILARQRTQVLPLLLVLLIGLGRHREPEPNPIEQPEQGRALVAA